VADVSHLLAELLDNASSFSPPESRVTVSGRYAGDHYLISIADEGVGIGADRLVELNDVLANPPIVGLSVEPTLGMSVVSLLAHKHGVQVRLVPSSPGLLVEVVLPAKLYGPIDATGMLGVESSSNGHGVATPGNLVELSPDPLHTDTSVPEYASAQSPAAPVAPTQTPEVSPRIELDSKSDTTLRAVTPADSFTVDSAPPTAAPTLEPEWSVEADWPVAPEWTVAPDPTEHAPTNAPAPASQVDASGFTAPQSHDRLSGEFDRPPAPPAFGFEPTSRPFTDPTVRPIAARPAGPERRAASGHANPSLPTRSRGTGPDGPDRLAAQLNGPSAPSVGHVAPTAPGSLKAALTAFEAGRSGVRPESVAPPLLPTRAPGNAFDHDDVTASTSQSRLDPEAIRERLRSFRQEFQLGRDGEAAAGHDGDQTDLGGDR
jgi:hypothetical protein